MISNAPTKGDMGCVWPKKGKQVAKGDDKKGNVMNGNKGVCTINKEYFFLGKVYKYKNRCPSVI
jgi:hypothetical protein